MQRLLLIAALLLTLANVVSPAMAASIADASTTSMVVLSDGASCLAPATELHQQASFKPCNKKVNGKSVPCHFAPMLFPVAAGSQFEDAVQVWDSRKQPLALIEVFAGQFRPPRSAVA